MANGTNVGQVYFSLEIDNQRQITRVVTNALQTAQTQVNAAARNMSTTINTAQQQTMAATRSMSNHINGASNSFSSLAKSVGLVTVAIVAMRKAWQFGREAVSLASDLQEVQNVVDVTFGSMSSRVDTFAKSAMDSIGLSEKVAKQYMGSFGAMSKSFGFTTEQAYNMSESLTSLAGDVASFYNLSSDMAYTKLKSVFTGETESLKDLGVVMTQTALDAYAIEQGWGKTTKAMSEQEKTLLRYNFVMDRLSLAQGDFIRTQDGWANQTRTLKLRFDELKATIGEGLIIALTPVIKMLNTLISKLTVAAQAFTGFVKTIFGIKDEDTSKIASDISDAGNAANGLSEGTAETAKNLAKAKKQLLGFDKLYKLADTSTSSTSTTDTGIGDVGSIGGAGVSSPAPTMTMPSASDLAKNLSNFAKTMLKTLKEKIDEVDWEGVGNQIGQFLHNIDWVAIAVGLVKVIFAAINAAFKTWKGMLDVAPVETAIITAFALLKFTGLGAIVTSAISKAIISKIGADSGTTLAAALGGWISKGFAGIKGLGINAASLVFGAGTMAEKFAFVGKMLGGIGAIIGGVITAFKNFFDMFANGFSWAKEILMLFGIALTAVGAIILGAPALIAGVVAAIVAVVANLVIAIKQNWEAISAWLSQAWSAIKTLAANIATAATTMMTNVGNGIKNAWASIQSWMSSKLTSFKNGFVNIFTGIKTSVINIITTLSNAMKAPINGMIGMLNRMIDGLNKLNINIPKWVPELGGKSLGFKIPRIPMLAAGGYVKPNNPQLAIIGDNKRQGEIVAPESKITEAVNNALVPFINTIVAALKGPQTAMASTGDIVIPVYIGNELIDQYIVNAQNRNTFRSGR